MEIKKIKCPNCGSEIKMEINEFLDAVADPQLKEKLLCGDYFLAKCPECGDGTLVEYPMMYIDGSKKLTVYMAPEHDGTLLSQLNSLEIPDGDLDEEAAFRLVSSSAELLEKILIADGGRDDRIIELYKAIICENIKEEWPQVKRQDLLYFYDEGEEYFIIWDFDNAQGEQLTVNIDDELYNQLKKDYLSQLYIPANQYDQVDGAWLEERIIVEP